MGNTIPTASAAETFKLYSIKDVCAQFGVGRHTMHRLLRNGDLERVKIGTRTLIPEASLRAYLAGRRAA